jgi:predicted DNA-binding transcriptional regulator AlpA
MQILSLKQAAARSGVGLRTIKRLLAAGTGPRTIQMSPRRVGVDEADLERWLRSRRRPQPAQARAPAAEALTP